jgi:sirohydrochlorin ferrochelatase
VTPAAARTSVEPAARAPGPTGADVPIVLVAHGSRDPRGATATRALARAVAAARPGRLVLPSYLDHTDPGPAQVLQRLQAAGHRAAVVVPLLLTAAYHRRVDIPETISAARSAGLRLPVEVADVLGPVGGVVDELLLAGLRRRLAEAAWNADAVVLAAAGTRDAAARTTVDRVASALGASLGLPCRAAYASAAPPDAGVAVERLRAEGARRVAVAAYFLAPGRLYETAVSAARGAAAVGVAAPLWAAPELAELVGRRADARVAPGVRPAAPPPTAAA